MFLAWFLFSFSSIDVSAAKLPAKLEDVQAQYKKSQGLEARFDQVTNIKATQQIKKAKGRIWIKRPNKLRWETLEPDPNILVSDGKTFWFYTPPFEKGERGQVIIKRSAQIQTQFLNALLSGSFDFDPGTAIEGKSPDTFILKPTRGKAGDIVSAEVTVDSKSHTIHRVVLSHSSGNVTEIRLTEIKLSSKLDDKLFFFSPDRNTDRITE